MGLDANKFNKLRLKVEKRLIGSYGSNKGLGQDLIIKKYTFTLNDYGDKTNTFHSQQTCKGIVISSNDYEQFIVADLNTNKSEVTLYIPMEYDVEDTPTYHYEFEFNNKTYVLSKANAIGQVCNVESGGVVREITIKKKIT